VPVVIVHEFGIVDRCHLLGEDPAGVRPGRVGVRVVGLERDVVAADKMIFSMTEDWYDAVVDVHLKGYVATSHHAGACWRRVAKSLGEGESPRQRRIINTTSESGLFDGPAQPNYGSAKGGIVSLTMILAKEIGRYVVTVNCIAPRCRIRHRAASEFVSGDLGPVEPPKRQVDPPRGDPSHRAQSTDLMPRQKLGPRDRDGAERLGNAIRFVRGSACPSGGHAPPDAC
jgi:NAD(P)-dependent dehydrogenase (short-subunit alcohol dehydrogenase family)